MGFEFGQFGGEGLREDFVEWLVDEQWPDVRHRFERLWDYYQNPMYELGGAGLLQEKVNESSRTYVQAQEVGLPTRITGMQYSGPGGVLAGRSVADIQRKEVVIENDIAWRINAMVDFLFGKGVRIISRASEARRRGEIEQILDAVVAANGGIGFFQDMAVLGSVYGFVDCVLRPGQEVLASFPRGDAGGPSHTHGPAGAHSLPAVLSAASRIGLELIEAPRALPVLDEADYRRMLYYVQNFYEQKNEVAEGGGFLNRLLGGFGGGGGGRASVMVTEVLGPDGWQRYEDKELVAQGRWTLGTTPVVHIQNLAQPYYYEGLSDVEQLLGLQDELNTRLSDRANRITFQAFKMYLAKGLEGFEEKPVSPGRMWCTDNMAASVEQFGGDAAAPSEDRHVDEVREAMDKVSGVTPVVAGLLKNKIGNLTSGVALKMTFMGMLAKTARKQHTYGQGIGRICEMVLRVLDASGVYRTEAEERDVEVVFANPLPVDEMDRLREAQAKVELGVSREEVLRELGYGARE